MDHNKLWKILIEMRYQTTFTCPLRNLYEGQVQQLEPDMEQLTGSKLGKEYNSTIYCHPTHLTCVQSVCLHAESLQWCLTMCNPVTLIHQAYLSMGFSWQYWNRLPFSTPEHLPNPVIKPESLTSTCIGRQVLYH